MKVPLLGGKTRTICRPGKTQNVDGQNRPGDPTTYTAYVSIQPLSPSRRQLIGNAFIRENAQMVAISTKPIQGASARTDHTGDYIVLKGVSYTFWAEMDEDQFGAPLAHYQYYLLSSEVQE